MGIFDIFKSILQGNAAADATTLQNMRRRQESERMARERQRVIDDHLKRRKKKLQASTLSLSQSIIGQPRLSSVQIHDILGFQPKSQKKRRRH